MKPLRDILVIEDETMVTQAVVMVCTAEGMTVAAEVDAAEGLRSLAQGRFRLVLCDIMLPGMDGFQFLERLARDNDHTPVVMMTGYSTMENAVRSLLAGAIDYIPKPFTADELMTVVRRSLRMASLLEEEQAPGSSRGDAISFVSSPANYHRLGHVSWVFMEDEGPAKIGISDLFLKAVDGIANIELQRPGEDLVQGIPCAFVRAQDGSEHGIMCPMGGKILEVNSEVKSDPSLIEKDPYFRGWLYRILPSNPESNLKWLSL